MSKNTSETTVVVSHNDSLTRRDLEPDYSVADWVGNRFNLARGTVS